MCVRKVLRIYREKFCCVRETRQEIKKCVLTEPRKLYNNDKVRGYQKDE